MLKVVFSYFFCTFVLWVLFVGCPASTLYSASSPVKVLNAQQFSSQIKKGNDVWLVEFFAPWCGHCKAFASDYEKAAKALQGIVKVAAVEDETVMASEGVKGFPTVRLYVGKSEPPSSKQYNGARTAGDLVKFVMQELSTLSQRRLTGKKASSGKGDKKKTASDQVVELTDATFDKLVMADKQHVWFVKFYAPWCGHCKALEDTWATLPSILKGKVMVGRLDATAYPNLAQKFGVQGYPTLKMFSVGEKSADTAVTYQGPREFDALVDFAMKFAGEAVEATQLLSDSQFNTECEKKLCILAFLPHIYDSKAAGRKKHLEEYNKAVRSAASMPINFFWLQGSDNFDLEEALHLQFGYPAIIAIHKEKKKYSIHKGRFTFQSIREFITGLMTGQQTLNTLPPTLPAFVTVDPWDGKDPVDDTENIKDEL